MKKFLFPKASRLELLIWIKMSADFVFSFSRTGTRVSNFSSRNSRRERELFSVPEHSWREGGESNFHENFGNCREMPGKSWCLVASCYWSVQNASSFTVKTFFHNNTTEINRIIYFISFFLSGNYEEILRSRHELCDEEAERKTRLYERRNPKTKRVKNYSDNTNWLNAYNWNFKFEHEIKMFLSIDGVQSKEISPQIADD